MYAKHWRDVDRAEWDKRWPNFPPQEVACRGTGELVVSETSLDMLQKLRDEVGPLVVTSAYRSEKHNKAVDGAKNSYHRTGQAFDIALGNHNPYELEAIAKTIGFTGIGRYPDRGFIHLDTGPERSWGQAWPRFQEDENDGYLPEPKRPTDPGKIVAAVSTVGGGIVAAASQAQAASDALGLSLSPMWIAVGALAIIGAGGALWWHRNRRRDAEPS